jgi:hypothetical protein
LVYLHFVFLLLQVTSSTAMPVFSAEFPPKVKPSTKQHLLCFVFKHFLTHTFISKFHMQTKMSLPTFFIHCSNYTLLQSSTQSSSQQVTSSGRKITHISPLLSCLSLRRAGALSMTSVPFLSIPSYFTELS